jgi:nicotinamide-nucleotide amidase
MAHGAARLLDADAVVSTTGAGGPDPEEGEPPGTVFVAVVVRGHETCVRLDLEGDPEQVLRDARSSALRILRESMRDSVQDDLNGRQPPGTARDGGPAGSPSPATSR